KAALVGGIAVAVLICIFLMIGISKMTGWFKFGGDGTTATTSRNVFNYSDPNATYGESSCTIYCGGTEITTLSCWRS
ncbi:MAG: hypothetical protein IIT45_10710, partial [Treponema sp.]|nr:hypothetical protein [Treponema sp.]